MTRVRLPYIKKVKKRRADGTVVEYHMIQGKPKSTFWRSDQDVPAGSHAYLEAYRAVTRPFSRPTGTKFDTIITRFLASEDFKRLAERTQRDYRKWCDEIRKTFGHAEIGFFNEPGIRKKALRWRDHWTGKQADYAITVLARIVSWALDEEEGIEVNHLLRIKRRYRADRADVIWRPDQVAAFCEVAPEWVRRILVTAVETGLRPSDLVRLTWRHIEQTPRGRRIRIRTKKRKRVAVIPVTPAVAEVLDTTPRDRPLILVSERGRPLTEHRASEGVRQWKTKAGLDDAPRLYDARGTAATALLRAGLDLDTIASIMGWSLRYAANVIEYYAQVVPEASDEVLVKLAEARQQSETGTSIGNRVGNRVSNPNLSH